MSTDVERVSWDEAVAIMRWRQGEHVTIVGSTGRGKTEIMISLLDLRKYIVFVTTKRQDDTQEMLRERRYHRETDPVMVNAEFYHRYLYAAPWGKMSEDDYRTKIIPRQRAAIDRLLTRLFSQGSWTIGLDELPYIADQLQLKDTLRLLWLQGRSAGVSVIANTQRPRHVPLEAYSQASHLFIYNTPDTQDILRSGDLIALDRAAVERVLRTLGRHDFLYVNVNDGHMCVSNTRS